MAMKLQPLAPDHHFDAPRRKRITLMMGGFRTEAWESAEEIEKYRREILKLDNWVLTYWDLLKFDISPRTKKAEKRINDAQKTLQKALGKLTPEERAQLLGLLTGA